MSDMAFALLSISSGLLGLTVAQAQTGHGQEMCSIFATKSAQNCLPFSGSFLGFNSSAIAKPKADYGILEDVFEALSVMQKDYFDPDYGTWPSSIDWTGAVVETITSGTLTTLSKSLGASDSGNWKAKENLISFYFAQVVNIFFGQDILSIRGEAYDDILWVVLGWLEAIKFINTHTSLHYPAKDADGSSEAGGIKDALNFLRWHGHNWVSAFAHRARVFWRLGAGGWDTKFCDGGMVWNRRLLPYKNAITNELWISASISMYERFPGDNFTAPWTYDAAFPEHDPEHLAAAIEGYKWLLGINMTNSGGLFVDGYHINDLRGGNTKCDLRDEMVYTYNQGVILTGHRGLWAVSGIPSYLQDGHKLIQSVIEATGWNLQTNTPTEESPAWPQDRLPPWRGLGRGGILEEACDASGTCSQDGQTFKGIFFHHLTAFCEPLSLGYTKPDTTVDELSDQQVRAAHDAACGTYLGWVKHNALAALETRDSDGHFGMWWGAGVFGHVLVSRDEDGINHAAENSTDYRNQGTPQDETWGVEDRWIPGKGNWDLRNDGSQIQPQSGQWVLSRDRLVKQTSVGTRPSSPGRDPNDRGRGRTVETQAGGLAVLRAYWEISQAQKLP